MRNDPFWQQTRTKTNNRSRILSSIAAKPSRFGELKDAVKLSPPVLSKYLKKLLDERMITRRVNDRRIEYVITEKGKDEERQRRESLTTALQMVKRLTGNPEALKQMSTLADFAKEDPVLFEGLLTFVQEFLLLIMSDDVKRWFRKHPGDEGNRILENEVMKRMRKRVRDLKPETETSADISKTFQLFVEIMREVFSEDQ